MSVKCKPLKHHCYIVKVGFTGVNLLFLFLTQNIYCVYSWSSVTTKVNDLDIFTRKVIFFSGLVLCPDGLMGFPLGCRMDEDCLKLKRYCYKALPGQLEDTGICCNQWLAYTSERKWNFHRLFEIADHHIKQ